MSDIDIAALRALLEKATPGKAEAFTDQHGVARVDVQGCPYTTYAQADPESDLADAVVDAMLRNLAPALLDEIERLRGALAIMTETMHDAVEELGDLNDAVSESLPEVSCDAEGNPGNNTERIQWAGERLAALERVREDVAKTVDLIATACRMADAMTKPSMSVTLVESLRDRLLAAIDAVKEQA